jgi:Flp pilus assembly protein TadG
MNEGTIRRFIRARDGAAAVEFGLVVGPLFLLILGLIEFGRMLWTLNALQETAIAGARCAGVLATACASGGAFSATNTVSDVQQVAADWGVTLTSANITVSNAASCAGVSGFSQVTINYTFQTVIPMIGALVADPLTATSCFPNQA